MWKIVEWSFPGWIFFENTRKIVKLYLVFVLVLKSKALYFGLLLTEKPYAHQGPIITIKLSENTENVTASDGSQQTQLVEMLFEMKYDTGHWRRLKRTRVVSKQGAAGGAPPQKNWITGYPDLQMSQNTQLIKKHWKWAMANVTWVLI